MCILLLTTSHPDYPAIFLSNRDEFLHRPTQRCQYWEAPNEHILSGRDLARPEKGTWLGVTRTGRIAVLTNFREASSAAAIAEKSRGAVVTSYLTAPTSSTTPKDPETLATCFPDAPAGSESTKAWIHNTLESGELKGVGGFSLVCGTLRPKKDGNLEPLAVISNRTVDRDAGVEASAHWIASGKGETHGLSNSLFDDPWPKVEIGCDRLSEVVAQNLEATSSALSAEEKESDLIERCFAVLSHDTLPKFTEDDTYETEINALVKSVFIPPFDAASERPKTKDTSAAPKAMNGAAATPVNTNGDGAGANTPEATIPAPSSPCGGAATPTPNPFGINPKTALQPPQATGKISKARPASLNVPLANSSQVDHIVATPVRPTYDGERKSETEPEEIEESIRKSPRIYGTQTQTVILVDKTGRLKYVERRLWDEDAKVVPKEQRERVVEFVIEGWEEN
ncbi:DUF833-domain-containing protein [Ascodesmis nigricans]|uniref:DUF833-domain-containing protein n=1 Tax=Ascodesmis nigricans TaxID=341454 RepID=A0A4V3SJN0_9PEZI|nr:DUF833-domain-containing protein [Ascodesmis nigricans]